MTTSTPTIVHFGYDGQQECALTHRYAQSMNCAFERADIRDDIVGSADVLRRAGLVVI